MVSAATARQHIAEANCAAAVAAHFGWLINCRLLLEKQPLHARPSTARGRREDNRAKNRTICTENSCHARPEYGIIERGNFPPKKPSSGNHKLIYNGPRPPGGAIGAAAG